MMPRRCLLPVRRYERAALPEVSGAPSSMRGTGRAPMVTVVIATYNRSNVLRLALASLVRQSFRDWEAVVIGDQCSDDSSRVVESFADARLTWWNLPANLGDQSGPNSVGARLARGRYIAWLNQDDLWFPGHLDSLVRRAEAEQAQFVASGWINVGPAPARAPDSTEVVAECWNPQVRRGPGAGGFHPASTWLARRDLVRRAGDWRPAAELRAAPSQEYLYRCWALGAEMRLGGLPTVVAIQSGRFVGSYSERRMGEHELIAPMVMAMTTDEVISRLGAGTPPTRESLRRRLGFARGPRSMGRAVIREGLMATAVPLAARIGMSPSELKALLKGTAPGAWMSQLRRLRGLPALPPQ